MSGRGCVKFTEATCSLRSTESRLLHVISDHLVPSNSSSRAPNFLRVFASVANQSLKRWVRFGTLSARDSPNTAASSPLVAVA